MKYYIISALLLSSFLPSYTQCADVKGIQMADTHTVAGKILTLNGMGVRQYSMFKVNIYVAGLYLEVKSSDEKAILSSPQVKQVRMAFMRDAGALDAREGWLQYLKDNADGIWPEISPVADKYLALLPDVKTGEVMIHDFTPGKVTVSVGDKKLGEVQGEAFSKVLLSTWIGKKPSTEDLKRGLLGK